MQRFLAAAAFALAAVAPAIAQDKVVNVYNWSDYIDQQVLKDFEKETGIKVVYDVYDKNETLEAKLTAGKSGYDVVVPSATFMQRFIKANLFQPLDRSKLKNYGNLWPEVMQKLQAYDPGNKFAVNYMWGTTGIGINVAKVKERLGNMRLDTWDLVFKPEIAAKLKDCGIYILDAPEDVFPSVLRYLGINPDSKSEADLRKATDALMKIRGYVRKFHSSEYINALANGDICIALGYSGDVLQAANRAKEAKNNVEIAYLIPREGAMMWFDSLAIPIDAPNPANAHAFIDYLMRPDVAAKNTNLVNFASGNIKARPLVDEAIQKNTGVYPSEEVMKKLFITSASDERYQRALTRAWTRVTTGR